MKVITTTLLALATLLLASCANSSWVKEGVSEQARNADQAECRQLARREARNLAWEDRFDRWSPYSAGGYYDGAGEYPAPYWPYAWQWDYYSQPFHSGPLMQDHTYSLTNFCMRSKGYTLEQSGRQS